MSGYSEIIYPEAVENLLSLAIRKGITASDLLNDKNAEEFILLYRKERDEREKGDR